jgi:hypothetical protein
MSTEDRKSKPDVAINLCIGKLKYGPPVVFITIKNTITYLCVGDQEILQQRSP